MYIKKNGKHSFAFLLNVDDVFIIYNGFAKANNFEIVGLINIKNKQQAKKIALFMETEKGSFVVKTKVINLPLFIAILRLKIT